MPRPRVPKWLAIPLILICGLVWLFHDRIPYLAPFHIYGPKEATVLTEPPPLAPNSGPGRRSRLAVFVTRDNLRWLPLTQGLQGIGIPLTVTTEWDEAKQHRVILLYPMPAAPSSTPAQLAAFSDHIERGGTLIGISVHGDGLPVPFGFRIAKPSNRFGSFLFSELGRTRFGFDHPHETSVLLAKPGQRSPMESFGFFDPQGDVLARFQDGTPALIERRAGLGRAIALGIDLGHLAHIAYANLDPGLERSYVNGYEPTLDVFLRVILQLYREGEPLGVLLGTVPQGKELPIIWTHDIDYAGSLENAEKYAEWAKSRGFRSTFFVQTKYVRDAHDEAFFNPKNLPLIKRLADLGMEIGSHSVSHSRAFWDFQIGSGSERYPIYQPFNHSAERTSGGSLLGELRVSRFLLQQLVTPEPVVSFRPGYLANPSNAPQAISAVGYRFCSTVTANNSLTHFPFSLTGNRSSKTPLPLVEIPVGVEDEEEPPLLNRLDKTEALAERLARYGAPLVVLIHPNETGDKLEFERRLSTHFAERAWFGALGDFGAWWMTRAGTTVDVQSRGEEREVEISLPASISGLPIIPPPGWVLVAGEGPGFSTRQVGGNVILNAGPGLCRLRFRVRS